MNIRIISLLFFLCLISKPAFSQTYFGAGYAGGHLSVSGLEVAHGISFYLIKEFKLGDSRFRIDPALNIALLFSEIDKPASPFYATMTSLTPTVAFELIQSKRIIIAPFAGPYANWVIGSRSGSILFEPAYMNEVRFGFEFGLAANILIGDDFSIKIIPLNYQVAWFNEDDYFDGSYFLKFTSSILIRL